MMSPSFRFLIAAAPFTAVSRKPLYLARSIENEVRGIYFGVAAATSLKAWLSVMTMRGGILKESITPASSAG